MQEAETGGKEEAGVSCTQQSVRCHDRSPASWDLHGILAVALRLAQLSSTQRWFLRLRKIASVECCRGGVVRMLQSHRGCQ